MDNRDFLGCGLTARNAKNVFEGTPGLLKAAQPASIENMVALRRN